MFSLLRSLSLLFVLANAGLSAQTTFHVSGSNLESAIRAAKAGDILIVTGPVMKPTFGPLVIDKPLFIYGRNSGFWIMSGRHVVIRSIPKGAALTLSGFGGLPLFEVQDCAGHVLLANLTGQGPKIRNCADVSLAGCKMSLVDVTKSRVAISQCELKGTWFSTRFPHWPGTHGVQAKNSALTVWDSMIRGGRTLVDLAAVNLVDSSLWLHRSTLENIIVNAHPPAVAGNGTVDYDPSVVFRMNTSAKPFSATTKATRRPLPLFTMPQTPIGGTAKATFQAAAGSVYGMIVGVPGVPVAVPGIHGVLEVAHPVLVRLGTLPTNGLSSLSFTVPNVAVLRGRMFRWQGITAKSGTAEWSNAVTESHY